MTDERKLILDAVGTVLKSQHEQTRAMLAEIHEKAARTHSFSITHKDLQPPTIYNEIAVPSVENKIEVPPTSVTIDMMPVALAIDRMVTAQESAIAQMVVAQTELTAKLAELIKALAERPPVAFHMPENNGERIIDLVKNAEGDVVGAISRIAE